MNSTAITVVALLIAAPLQAQTLPAALTDAKTVVVVNDGVDQGIYDELVKAVRGWKRLTVVESPAPADVTLAISSEHKVGSNWANGQTVTATAYRLTFKNGETVLYSDSAKGCCSIKAMMRKTLEKLDKRMMQ